jgi:mono/diheme cytochrome c family protein
MKNKKMAFVLSIPLLFSNFLYAQVKPVKKVVYHQSIAASLARGKMVYTNICLACHMADGGGVQNMNPPLTNTTYVLGSKTKLIQIVLNGFKDDVEINGQTYQNVMTPHSDLKDKQIADVLTYVRNSFGNKASRVTVAEVKKARAGNKKS